MKFFTQSIVARICLLGIVMIPLRIFATHLTFVDPRMRHAQTGKARRARQARRLDVSAKSEIIAAAR